MADDPSPTGERRDGNSRLIVLVVLLLLTIYRVNVAWTPLWLDILLGALAAIVVLIYFGVVFGLLRMLR